MSRTFYEVMHSWRESHKDAGYHGSECCVDDLLSEAEPIYRELLGVVKDMFHSIPPNAMENRCYPNCPKCRLERILGRLSC